MVRIKINVSSSKNSSTHINFKAEHWVCRNIDIPSSRSRTKLRRIKISTINFHTHDNANNRITRSSACDKRNACQQLTIAGEFDYVTNSQRSSVSSGNGELFSCSNIRSTIQVT